MTMPKQDEGSLEYFLEHDANELLNRYVSVEDLSFKEMQKEIWGRFSKTVHAKDRMEGYIEIFHGLAKARPEVLIKALEDREVESDPTKFYIISALAAGQPTQSAVDALCRAADQEDLEVRSVAVKALVKREKAATHPKVYAKLQERLQDREGMASYWIFEGISDPDFFDFPYAIKKLRKRLARIDYRNTNPEAWARENAILEELESRPHNARRRRRKPKIQPTTPGDPKCSSPSKKS